MGMSIPEQADFSAEQSTESPDVIEQLYAERDAVGGTSEYLTDLALQYETTPEYAVNMLQLKRMANFATNPNNESSFPARYTDAFYRGEVLGFRVSESIVGDKWPDQSYKLFGKNMTDSLRQLRVKAEVTIDELGRKATHPETLQMMADLLMGELDHADVEKMPQILDEFMLQWADEMSDDEGVQAYALVGFRHVVMQLAADQEAARKKKEKEKKPVSQPLVEAGDFYDIMFDSDLEIDNPDDTEIESLNDVRARLIEKYALYMSKYGFLLKSETKKIAEATTDLTTRLNRDLLKMEGIEIDDDILISGDAMYVIGDKDGSQTKAIQLLRNGQTLKGSVDSIVIREVVATESIPIMKRFQEDSTASAAGTAFNPLGVVLLLKNPLIQDADGELQTLGDGATLGLVLNNPNMDIARYI